MADRVFTEFWSSHYCPECSTKNWTYMGHSDDEYYQPAEACECGQCGHVYWLLSEMEIEDVYPSDVLEDGETALDLCMKEKGRQLIRKE